MADVFVSYKAEDRARIAPLVQALQSDGLSVWWDEHIGVGDQWRETIVRELETALTVLVIWSRRSIGPHGQFVRDEASRALRRGAYLPVRIDKVELPIGFGETQALDLSGWKGDRSDRRYEAVANALRRRTGLEDQARSAQRAGQQWVSRRSVLVGAGAIGAASIAGLGGWYFMQGEGEASDSIAVLPFANLSGDPAQAYFADGIAEELRSALSRIGGLKVVARTSSEAVRNDDATSAAHKLGVSNILTGSVRRSSQVIRIGAQLVDGSRGIERWSAVFDRSPGDALQIQTDIAGKVADALSIRLGGDDRKRLEEGGTSNPQAHDLVLKAQEVFQAPMTLDAVQGGIVTTDAAIELDPNYAAAWGVKAGLQMIAAGVFATSASEAHAGYARALESSRRAITLAPHSRLGYARLAEILDQQLERRAAHAEYERMQSLPGQDGEDGYAMHLSETLHHDQALRVISDALSGDPLNPRIHWARMSILGYARRYNEALAAARQLATIAAPRAPPHGFIGQYLFLLGRNDEAEVEFTKAGQPFTAVWQAALAVRRGDLQRSNELLTQLTAASGDAAYFQQAEILAQQGKQDLAVAALEKAYGTRDPGLTSILVDPLLDPLRSAARFQLLVKKLDFPT